MKNGVTEIFIKHNLNYLSRKYQISNFFKNRSINRDFKNSKVQKSTLEYQYLCYVEFGEFVFMNRFLNFFRFDTYMMNN